MLSYSLWRFGVCLVVFRFHWWVTSGVSVWQWFRPVGKRGEEVRKRAASLLVRGGSAPGRFVRGGEEVEREIGWLLVWCCSGEGRREVAGGMEREGRIAAAVREKWGERVEGERRVRVFFRRSGVAGRRGEERRGRGGGFFVERSRKI
ncbi:hypothetical protein HAX54_024110 [Datura stramonium]|uniref:Uncharacterized protein n=1 Tax=Datura stramonium TaxID=4076 RepID=A0ABS8UXQ6_DATST|nr:hypothetical protein [Datura stramonium]